MKTPPPATEASDAELERFKAWLAINDPRPFTPGAYSYQAAKWKAWQAALSYPAAAVGGEDRYKTMYYSLVEAFDKYAQPWLREDGDGGFAGTLMRMATAATPPAGGFVVVPPGGDSFSGWAAWLRDHARSFDPYIQRPYAELLAIWLDEMGLKFPGPAMSPTAQPSAIVGPAQTESEFQRMRRVLGDIRRGVEVKCVNDNPAAQPSAKDGARGEPEFPEDFAHWWNYSPWSDASRWKDGYRDVAYSAWLAAQATTATGLVDDAMAKRVLEEWQRATGGTMVNKYWHDDQIKAMRAALQSVWPGQQGEGVWVDLFRDQFGAYWETSIPAKDMPTGRYQLITQPPAGKEEAGIGREEVGNG